MQDEYSNDMNRIPPDAASETGVKNTVGNISRPQAERPRFKPETGGNSGISRTGARSRKRTSMDKILPVLCLVLLFLIGMGAGVGIGYRIWGYEKPYTVDLKVIKSPDWIEQKLLRKNIFSRPDVSMREVKNIVVHYIGNPNTSADSNQRYFDNLADQDPEKGGTSSSSHFIVGLEGEIIQCIPVSEISYANAPRNFDTVSIEVCHPDETGKFTDASYDSLVKLTAWLCGELKLDEKDV